MSCFCRRHTHSSWYTLQAKTKVSRYPSCADLFILRMDPLWLLVHGTCIAMDVQGLISHAEVVEREAGNGLEQPGDANHSPGAITWGRSSSLASRFSRSLIEEEDPADEVTLYEQGKPSDTFTLILQGKVLIRTGAPSPLRLNPKP